MNNLLSHFLKRNTPKDLRELPISEDNLNSSSFLTGRLCSSQGEAPQTSTLRTASPVPVPAYPPVPNDLGSLLQHCPVTGEKTGHSSCSPTPHPHLHPLQSEGWHSAPQRAQSLHRGPLCRHIFLPKYHGFVFWTMSQATGLSSTHPISLPNEELPPHYFWPLFLLDRYVCSLSLNHSTANVLL